MANHWTTIRQTVRREKDVSMRKGLTLAAASAVAAIGIGLAMASPASAETFGSYHTQEECEAAKTARGGVNLQGEPLHCAFIRETPQDPGMWLLMDNRGGG
ncbi:hypothetical protein [Streptomyces sp. NPDC005799]|uniref:hypothetical protein n=1 Tax=Streptomyces sp. NPDC005799 TaxID=3154678 RepID=UPI0033E2CDBA